VSVDNANVIDACSIDKGTAEVVLSIFDHLSWTDATHLAVLQGKINRYLDFIDSGQLLEDYPQGKGRPIQIAIWLKYPPDDVGKKFLATAEAVLQKAKCRLSVRVKPEWGDATA